jgi:hypothetical protein
MRAGRPHLQSRGAFNGRVDGKFSMCQYVAVRASTEVDNRSERSFIRAREGTKMAEPTGS